MPWSLVVGFNKVLFSTNHFKQQNKTFCVPAFKQLNKNEKPLKNFPNRSGVSD